MAHHHHFRNASAQDVRSEADRINEVFQAFDLDGNGKVSADEFKRLFQTLDHSRWTDEKIKELISAFDKNLDGSISFTEFVTWSCSSKSDKHLVDKVLDDKASVVAKVLLDGDSGLFQAFDADSDKKVNREELSAVLYKLVPDTFSQKEVQAMMTHFEKADVNKDNKLSVKEFITLVCCWHSDEKAAKVATTEMTKRVQTIVDQEVLAAQQRQIEKDMERKKGRKLTHTPVGREFMKFLEEHPWVARSGHSLHQWVTSCRAEICEGDDKKAQDMLLRMKLWDENETVVLKAAFERFDYSTEQGQKNAVLSKNEVHTMFEYLGFPAGEEDVQEFFKVIDKDKDGGISLDEFQRYVGRVGGIYKLFEVRRRQLEKARRDKSGDLAKASREDLLATGIMDDAQGYWRLVVPETELLEAASLIECQRKAVRHIRALAAVNHANALPGLLKRYKDLGFTEVQLKKTLDFIREQAPLIIHVDLDTMMQYFETDTNYRNQFETHSSGGCLSNDVRREWEFNLFGDSYDDSQFDVKGFDRPKYGVLNVFNDPRGIICCEQYGDSYLVMKDVRLRVTGSPEDSCCCAADRLSVLDYYGHVLNEYPDEQLKAVCAVANGEVLDWDSEVIVNYDYKELQYHGEIRFDKHVERLVASERHRPADESRLRAICDKHGWAFSWMTDDAEAIKSTTTPAHNQKIGDSEWKQQVELRASDV